MATKPQISKALDVLDEAEALATTDPERAHSMVDDILLKLAPVEVAKRVTEIKRKAHWWAAS